MFPDMMEVELCSSGGRQSSDCTDKVALFSHRVNYDHDGILPIRFQKLHYEVNTGCVPGCIWDWKGMEFSEGQQMNGFSLEAHIAGGDIFAYVPGHLQPPVIYGDQFQCLPSSRMSSKFGVVTKGQNLTVKLGSGNVDFASVIKQTVLQGLL